MPSKESPTKRKSNPIDPSTMNVRTVITYFWKTAALSVLLNILWLAAMAAPISWLWNWIVVPLGKMPVLSYKQALGLIVLCFLIKHAFSGLQVSAKFKESE